MEGRCHSAGPLPQSSSPDRWLLQAWQASELEEAASVHPPFMPPLTAGPVALDSDLARTWLGLCLIPTKKAPL